VDLVGANLALGAIDQLGDLGRVGVDTRAGASAAAPIAAGALALGDVVGDGFVIDAGQRRCASQRADQIECLQNLHHFLRSFHRGPLVELPEAASPNERDGRCRPIWPVLVSERGEPMAAHGEVGRPPVGRFGGRLWGGSHGRRHSSSWEPSGRVTRR
jgi:hypothetical protein